MVLSPIIRIGRMHESATAHVGLALLKVVVCCSESK